MCCAMGVALLAIKKSRRRGKRRTFRSGQALLTASAVQSPAGPAPKIATSTSSTPPAAGGTAARVATAVRVPRRRSKCAAQTPALEPASRRTMLTVRDLREASWCSSCFSFQFPLLSRCLAVVASREVQAAPLPGSTPKLTDTDAEPHRTLVPSSACDKRKSPWAMKSPVATAMHTPCHAIYTEAATQSAENLVANQVGEK